MILVDVLTAGRLRELLADVPDREAVMIVVDGVSAVWATEAAHDAGGRTFDVSGGIKDRYGSGPHLLTARDGAQAYCGGPGLCRACDTTITTPLADLLGEIARDRLRRHHTHTAAWACYRTATGRQVHVQSGCRCPR